MQILDGVVGCMSSGSLTGARNIQAAMPTASSRIKPSHVHMHAVWQ